MEQRIAAYTIRDIPASTWRRVKVQAAKRGESIRTALFRWMDAYGGGADMPSAHVPQAGPLSAGTHAPRAGRRAGLQGEERR